MSKKKFYKRVAKLAGANVSVTIMDIGDVLTVSLGGGEGGSPVTGFSGDDRYAKALGWLKSNTFLVRSSVLRSEVASLADVMVRIKEEGRPEPDLLVDAPFSIRNSTEPSLALKVRRSPAQSVDAETILDRVTALAAIAGYDVPVVKWALTQAAHELREVPTQSFWNAADELEGIVRDKTGEPVGADPHAEVPA